MHWVDSSDNEQLCLNFTKYQNSCLLKQYPSSFSGDVDNHFDAPFSWCMSINFSFPSAKQHRITFDF